MESLLCCVGDLCWLLEIWWHQESYNPCPQECRITWNNMVSCLLKVDTQVNKQSAWGRPWQGTKSTHWENALGTSEPHFAEWGRQAGRNDLQGMDADEVAEKMEAVPNQNTAGGKVYRRGVIMHAWKKLRKAPSALIGTLRWGHRTQQEQSCTELSQMLTNWARSVGLR